MGAVLSEKADAEVAELHTAMEEGFERIGNLTKQLQAVGGFPGSSSVGGLPSATLGGQPGLGGGLPSATLGGQPGLGGEAAGTTVKASSSAVSSDKIAAIRKLESDFAALQQTAFRIGRESQDNTALSQHPEMNNYIQNLREFRPRVKDMVDDLEKALFRITGKSADKPKKRKKPAKTIQGLAEDDIRIRAQKAVASDSRDFRTKAMDIVSTFRERQLQMQDKQRDMQLAMDGPDWPKEDWPLSTADAKHVGEAETMIGAALQELTAKIDPLGGLPRIHESGDESALQLLSALSDMMSGYGELIDRHVDTVKKVYRNKKKPKAAKSQSAAHAGGASSSSAASLRDQLLNFGSQQGTSGQQRPFAWLHGGEGDGQAQAGTLPQLNVMQHQHTVGASASYSPNFGADASSMNNAPPQRLAASAQPGIAHASGAWQAGGMPSAAAAGDTSASSSLAKLAGLTSSLGSLGSIGASFQSMPAAHSTSQQPAGFAGSSFSSFAQPTGRQPVHSESFGGWSQAHVSSGGEL